MKIGIVGLQGAVSEHLEATRAAMEKLRISGDAVWLNSASQLNEIDGIIIPGGESTTIGKLMKKTGIFEGVRDRGIKGTPIFGTCAGLILMAKRGDDQVKQTGQPLLGFMDMEIVRNAFGRQRESFEAGLKILVLNDSMFKGVFIRAPAVRRVWADAQAIAEFNGMIVGVLQRNFLAVAFHPELTPDTRVHEYFLEMCKK